MLPLDDSCREILAKGKSSDCVFCRLYPVSVGSPRCRCSGIFVLQELQSGSVSRIDLHKVTRITAVSTGAMVATAKLTGDTIAGKLLHKYFSVLRV